jgi:hypothetical protein
MSSPGYNIMIRENENDLELTQNLSICDIRGNSFRPCIAADTCEQLQLRDSFIPFNVKHIVQMILQI